MDSKEIEDDYLEEVEEVDEENDASMESDDGMHQII